MLDARLHLGDERDRRDAPQSRLREPPRADCFVRVQFVSKLVGRPARGPEVWLSLLQLASLFQLEGWLVPFQLIIKLEERPALAHRRGCSSPLRQLRCSSGSIGVSAAGCRAAQPQHLHGQSASLSLLSCRRCHRRALGCLGASRSGRPSLGARGHETRVCRPMRALARCVAVCVGLLLASMRPRSPCRSADACTYQVHRHLRRPSEHVVTERVYVPNSVGIYTISEFGIDTITGMTAPQLCSRCSLRRSPVSGRIRINQCMQDATLMHLEGT
mmetsp:Transcript_72300/g.233653  ORF Transcript_72300/g.233653 Transcript_72300/m.233653 type:complete len:273 (-) Transcript_72300:10-828(-)